MENVETVEIVKREVVEVVELSLVATYVVADDGSKTIESTVRSRKI